MFITSFLITIFYIIAYYLFISYVYLCDKNDTFCDYACKEMDALDPVYDYIVVGAGSAGCAIALRLAEDGKNTVLLLEAGGHGGSFFDIPAFGPMLQNTAFDWQYKTVPQATAALALDNQKSNWPMGKIVGGTSKLNNMIHIRGHHSDFDKWFKDDADYDYSKDILPYFLKSERHLYKHKYDGILPLTDVPFSIPLSDSIIEGAAELNFPNLQINGKELKGFMKSQVSMLNGSRWTTSHSLLESMKTKSNFRLVTNTLVTKVIFNGSRAYGVNYNRFGENLTVSARKEIILSAGVIGTPKLLMLSGIGPKESLSKNNIYAWNDLPVGENLQDHVTTGLDLIELNQSAPLNIVSMLNPFNIMDYWKGGGLWTSPGCEVIGFINSKNSTDSVPDLQFIVIPAGVSENKLVLQKNFGITDSVWSRYFSKLTNKSLITILPVVLHPKSKGYVRLKNNDPLSEPLINPRYLSSDEDVVTLINGIKFLKKLVETKPLRKFDAKINVLQFPGCENHLFDSEQYWECYVRHLTLTTYHPIGTCKMGPETDSSTVVNYEFKVHNTDKLRIADASVMPTMLSGNINAAVVMIAEKVSEMILRDNAQNNKYCSRLQYNIYNIYIQYSNMCTK